MLIVHICGATKLKTFTKLCRRLGNQKTPALNCTLRQTLAREEAQEDGGVIERSFSPHEVDVAKKGPQVLGLCLQRIYEDSRDLYRYATTRSHVLIYRPYFAECSANLPQVLFQVDT